MKTKTTALVVQFQTVSTTVQMKTTVQKTLLKQAHVIAMQRMLTQLAVSHLK